MVLDLCLFADNLQLPDKNEENFRVQAVSATRLYFWYYKPNTLEGKKPCTRGNFRIHPEESLESNKQRLTDFITKVYDNV